MSSEILGDDIETGDRVEVVPLLAMTLAEAMHADRCAVFVYSEDQKETVALFRYGYDDTGLAAHVWTDLFVPSTVPAEAHVIATKQPLQRRCPEDFERFPLVNPGQHVLEGRLTDLTIPLIWNDGVQGCACLWRRSDPSPYSDGEIERAMELGRLMAMTIVFARQYDRERMQRQRLATLLDVASIASSEMELNDVLPVLASAVRTATDAEVCSLYVFDEQGDDVLAAFQDGMVAKEESVFEASKSVPVHEVPAEVRMRHTRKPIIIRDFQRDLADGSPLCSYAIEYGLSEILLLPVSWQGETVGAVYCWFRQQDRRFSQASVDIAEAIAQQAGGVVARGRMEEQLRRQAAESEALLTIGQAVLASEVMEPVLDQIAGALEKLIPYSYACVAMLTPGGEHVRVIREWGSEYQSILGTLIPVNASISGDAVREARLVISDHALDDPRTWKDIPRKHPLHSLMVAPLVYDNSVFGTLLLARNREHRFTTREAQFLTLLSQQAAVAIERVKSREDLARQAERQAFLARVGDLLVAGDNPEHALKQIAGLGAGVIADGIIIGLAGWEYGSMRWVADSFDDPETSVVLHHGLQDLDLTPLQEHLEAALVSNREMTVTVSGARHADLREWRELMERTGSSQALIIPLFQQERAPGLLLLLARSDDPSHFQEEGVQVGRIIAQRIGDELERYQVKRNHEGILRVSEALYGLSDSRELVRTIAVELERIIPCDQLIIANVDVSSQMLHTQAYRKHGADAPGRAYFSLDEGLCGEAIRQRQPIIDNQADLRPTSVYGSHNERVFYLREGESAMVAPLIVDDDVIGVIFINRTGHSRFTSTDLESLMLFAGMASAALDRTTLEEHNRVLYRASTEVLAAVVDAKDPTTLKHSRNVAIYSRLLAELMELPVELVERIELAGHLHDIGKLGIPDHVLSKPERLTDDEFALIKSHPDRGARILERHPALEDLIPMVRHHHEAQDGSGYPSGLAGEEIPIGASIICVADAFDTMTSERTYQRRRGVEESLAELERCSGSQFQPELVRRFVERVLQDRSSLPVCDSSIDEAG